MKIVKTYQIGLVKIVQLNGADLESTRYSDGDSENVLYKIYKSKDAQHEIKKVMGDKPPWPLYYHLSPYRKNVIDWYEFEDEASVLEIGAGCGAVTEALCRKNLKVTALELTKRRAEINAHRNKEAENLEIIIGNLEEYKTQKKFDYIICVGVLEYAGIFINSKEPYEDFIALLSGFLKKDGKLIVAIENRLGLKYLSGAREDHTGRFFDGINQYPHPKKVQTFGKVEITNLIKNNGFNNLDFYYPFPDYKNPMLIYSDQFTPGRETNFPVRLLPTPSHDQQNRNRVHFFSEQLSMISVDRNQLYGDLANSFLVIAQKNGKHVKPSTLFYTSTANRKSDYELKTYLKKDVTGKFKFYKEVVNKEAVPHIRQIYKNSRELTKIFDGSFIKIVEAKKEGDERLVFEYIEGITIERILFEAIVEEKYDKFIEIIDKFIEAVHILPGDNITDKYLIDLNFDNIIINKNGDWCFIDYEWLLKQSVPKDLIIQRSLIYLVG